MDIMSGHQKTVYTEMQTVGFCLFEKGSIQQAPEPR